MTACARSRTCPRTGYAISYCAWLSMAGMTHHCTRVTMSSTVCYCAVGQALANVQAAIAAVIGARIRPLATVRVWVTAQGSPWRPMIVSMLRATVPSIGSTACRGI